jgi:uncharacterized membrane protein (Fun14 family)
METVDLDGVVQSIELSVRNPHVLHAALAVVLGLTVGLLFRILLKILLLSLAVVIVLLIALQSFDIVLVQINPQAINRFLVKLVEFMQRFSVKDHTIFAGSIFVGFKYGLFGWMKK